MRQFLHVALFLFLCLLFSKPALSAMMIMEDLEPREAAVMMMINAERTLRGFQVPLFVNPILTLTSRLVAASITLFTYPLK